MSAWVGVSVGASVGISVGVSVGVSVGAYGAGGGAGVSVGTSVGISVGVSVGVSVGTSVGISVCGRFSWRLFFFIYPTPHKASDKSTAHTQPDTIGLIFLAFSTFCSIILLRFDNVRWINYYLSRTADVAMVLN